MAQRNNETKPDDSQTRQQAGPPVVRFAPSPNGYLHIGHAFSALVNFAVAQRAGGRFLLRIEDIDSTRVRPEFEQAIFDDLAWLGIRWEEPVRRQSQHLDQYAGDLQRLEAAGLLYRCFCTRGDIRACLRGKEQWPHDPDGSPIYPGTCRRLSAAERAGLQASGKPFALRLDMRQAIQRTGADLQWREFGEADQCSFIVADPLAWGDIILARKDIGTSYHIASVSDDNAQGVTDVIRGDDIRASTAIHRLLQILLGFPQPRYRHHRLLLDSADNKFSKSGGAISLRSLRGEGVTANDIKLEIRNMLQQQYPHYAGGLLSEQALALH